MSGSLIALLRFHTNHRHEQPGPKTFTKKTCITKQESLEWSHMDPMECRDRLGEFLGDIGFRVAFWLFRPYSL
jgi:hypothetical protein